MYDIPAQNSCADCLTIITQSHSKGIRWSMDSHTSRFIAVLSCKITHITLLLYSKIGFFSD